MPARATSERTERSAQSGVLIRRAEKRDVGAITRIDARCTGVAKPHHWRALVEDCRRRGGVALVAERRGQVAGYLLGEVRAWEFGSPPVGWVYAVAVDPKVQGSAVGRSLVEAARARFAEVGIASVRTMVQRESIDLLRFFRRLGFVAGPFVEMEVGP